MVMRLNDPKNQIALAEAVNVCPFCGRHIDPIYIHHEVGFAKYDEGIPYNTYYVFCQCPSKDCKETFFTRYSTEEYPIGNDDKGATIYDVAIISSEIYPTPKPRLEFDRCIYELSPEFIDIYTESLTAELTGLINICGSGYRLSFEVLIKDFATFLTPNKADEIKADTMLSNVLQNRIPTKPSFDDLKNIGSRAWWLGSDYVHYNKNYTDKDIDDLKNCINLTVVEITHHIMREKYIKEISKV